MADIDLICDMDGAAEMSVELVEGPIYFAWVEPGTAFDPVAMQVNDENVFAFEVEQEEGDFATMTTDIINPKVGLLTPTRKVWAYLSWFNGSEVVPLFYGRLDGIPDDMDAEIVTLKFTARPIDFADQKAAVAETLKSSQAYDPLFVAEDKRSDPDTVLEAMPVMWHIGRVDHVVSVSHVLTGEDGLQEFGPDDLFYDAVKVTRGEIPLRTIQVTMEFGWTQTDQAGVELAPRPGIDIGPYLAAKHWPGKGGLVDSLTGDGLQADWPKDESRVGGGWEVVHGAAEGQMGYVIPDEFGPGDFVGGSLIPTKTPPGSYLLPCPRILNQYAIFMQTFVIPNWWLKPVLVVGYDVSRNRKDIVTFTVSANVQPIVTLPGEDEIKEVKLNAADLLIPIDGVTPLDDARRRTFVTTPRGLKAIEYGLCYARSALLMKSRAVNVDFDIDFERAVVLSCRMNSRVTGDDRIPGGVATGKIISYKFGLNGDDGAMYGAIKMGCPVGYGNTVTAEPGEPTYISADYIGNDYQYYSGKTVVLEAGDVGYTPPADNPQDDGIDFMAGFKPADIVLASSVLNTNEQQKAALDAALPTDSVLLWDQGEAFLKEALDAIPTTVSVQFLPLTGGPFESPYPVVTTDLVIPQGINLEATTNAP